MKYVKYRKSYHFVNLKNDNDIRKQYSDVLVYTRSYPYTFYCWFAYEMTVVFFKRPQFLSDNTLIHSVIIKTDSLKAAKVIARNITEKELKRMFNKCNSVIL